MKKKTQKKVFLSDKNSKQLRLVMSAYFANHMSEDVETQARDYLISILYKKGITITEIAEEVGLNKSTVSRIIKSNKELLEKL